MQPFVSVQQSNVPQEYLLDCVNVDTYYKTTPLLITVDKHYTWGVCQSLHFQFEKSTTMR
uniref:AlNc14C74G5012 protein n=1 Tax=Albugo laibachii Nc14 TaxID=890382 RepID=F0WEF5_9STRA|nr:AlNc14C74G5012 [Albugo laibachii Nc14]|eukprot:CCA19587.1 AlNc14C74G5012 [Albugo laibachii Nc14]